MINETIECLNCGEWLGSVRGADTYGPVEQAQFLCECGMLNMITAFEEDVQWP